VDASGGKRRRSHDPHQLDAKLEDDRQPDRPLHRHHEETSRPTTGETAPARGSAWGRPVGHRRAACGINYLQIILDGEALFNFAHLANFPQEPTRTIEIVAGWRDDFISRLRKTPHCGFCIACNDPRLMTGQAPRLGPAIGGLTGDPHRWGRFVFRPSASKTSATPTCGPTTE
jgi:hypothetical protein